MSKPGQQRQSSAEDAPDRSSRWSGSPRSGQNQTSRCREPRVLVLAGEGARPLQSISSSEPDLLHLLVCTYVHLRQYRKCHSTSPTCLLRYLCLALHCTYSYVVCPSKMGGHTGGQSPLKEDILPPKTRTLREPGYPCGGHNSKPAGWPRLPFCRRRQGSVVQSPRQTR